LNRVDEIIVFPQLNKLELRQIVDLFVSRLRDRLLDRDLSIEMSDAAKDRLIDIGFDPTLGARPLRRAMQSEIEDRISERILDGDLSAGDHIKVDYVDGQFEFDIVGTDQVVRVDKQKAARGSVKEISG
jgi:ATP-dependent Clp protease ATP-binding subunit ClpC